MEMENTTRLTWAIPVEAHILGASLEAYVESKASIRTFKLCAQYGKSSLAPVSTLPAELLNLVAGYIERSFFDERILEWEEAMHCVENFTDCEICDSLEKVYDEEHLEKHCDTVASHVQKVCSQRSFDTAFWRFNRFREIFAREFGLEIYFDFFRSWGEGDLRGTDPDSPSQIALGYLTLPTAVSKIKSCVGPGVASYLASTIVHPSILRPRSAVEKARFTTAMRRLHLTPHPHNLPVTGRRLSPEYTRANINAFVPHYLNYPNTDYRQKPDPFEELLKNRSPPAALQMKEWPQLMILSSGQLEAGSKWR